MEGIRVSDLWFSHLDPKTLCRVGGNGPKHPSQLYAIDKYVTTDMTFLDIGCGSGTTFEAMRALPKKYKGVDMIPANIDFCKEKFPDCEWQVGNAMYLMEEDQSWDVVYSRHLIEHLPSFAGGLAEQLRVAKQYVIIVLWASLLNGDSDNIQNIEESGKLYETEYSNRYSESNIKKTLNELTDWEIVEFTKEVGREVFGHDTIIVLKRREHADL